METSTKIQSTQPQSPVPMSPNNNGKFVIVLSTMLILSTSFGLYLWQKSSIPKEVTNESSLPVPTETLQNTQSSVPVIIYTERIKETMTESRLWPTEKILRKVGGAQPEILAEVGKVGEYPNNYNLSPDKKFLLINLESKLQILDLTTKELKDLFTPKRQVLSASYSPDSTQLFIWDQEWAPQDGNNSYYIHRFTISSRKDEILKQGMNGTLFFSGVWRDDGKVLLNEPRGDSLRPYYFEFASNQIVRTPGNYTAGLSSEKGTSMAIEQDWTGDLCNKYSGGATSAYRIIDPVSGETLGTFGMPNNRVKILAFSPNDSEIFYQTERPWTSEEDCNKIAEKSYFKAQIGTNQTVPVSNPGELLSNWSGNHVGAVLNYAHPNIWSILINGQSIITSNAELRIAGQYYK